MYNVEYSRATEAAYLLSGVSWEVLMAPQTKQDPFIRKAAGPMIAATLPPDKQWQWINRTGGGYMFKNSKNEHYSWRDGELKFLG